MGTDGRRDAQSDTRNYHVSTVASVASFLRQYTRDGSLHGLVLTGPRGTGKSYVVDKAVREAGCASMYVDAAAHNFREHLSLALFAGSPLLPDGTCRQTVCVVDAADELDIGAIRQLVSLLSAVSGTNTRVRRRVQLSPNPIIVTCCNRFHRNVYLLAGALHPTDVGCSLSADAVRALVRQECSTLPTPPPASEVRKVLSYGCDMNYILCQLRYLSITRVYDNVRTDRDPLPPDIFACVSAVLDPDEPVDLARCERAWDAGGPRMAHTVYNMYPHHVSTVHAARTAQERDAFSLRMQLEGLEQLEAIADTLSAADSGSPGWWGGNPALALVAKCVPTVECARSVRRRTRLKTDLDASTYNCTRPTFPGCSIDGRLGETLRYAALMHHLETDRKLYQDSTATLSDHYNPGYHIPSTGEPCPSGRTRKLTPRLRAIQVFSHTFPLSSANHRKTTAQ
jgi:hypothetical protein